VSQPAVSSSERDRAARRALFVEGIPLFVLGLAVLMLGSQPATSAGARAVWLSISVAFVLAVARVLYRAFRRADEYQRKIQLESMAVAFGVVLVALQVAGLLAASGVGDLRQSFQLIIVAGIVVWQGVADLRTRLGS
jgi:hypothetical protein